jgi:hypothetical protein
VSERRYTRDSPPRNSIAPSATQRPARLIGITDIETRFVLHVPFTAATLGMALEMAGRISDFLAFLPDIDQGETTVTYEGDQAIHQRVVCNLRLPGGGRCSYRDGHATACASIGDE